MTSKTQLIKSNSIFDDNILFFFQGVLVTCYLIFILCCSTVLVHIFRQSNFWASIWISRYTVKYSDVLTGGGGREGGGGGGGSLMTWINRKSKRASAQSPSGDVYRHTKTHTLKPCQDKRRRSWRRWFVTGDWVKQRCPWARRTAETPPLPGCFVTATGAPSPRWLLITRILLVNQHQGPPVQNKEKLKINLLTGESLGRAPLPV